MNQQELNGILEETTKSNSGKVAPKRWKSIATGTYHTSAIDEDDMLWAWGDTRNNAFGTGLSSIKEYTSPSYIA